MFYKIADQTLLKVPRSLKKTIKRMKLILSQIRGDRGHTPANAVRYPGLHSGTVNKH